MAYQFLCVFINYKDQVLILNCINYVQSNTYLMEFN